MILFKTMVTIWSEYDTSQIELEDLAREATRGDAYCSKSNCVLVEDYEHDPDWDGTEFFHVGDPEFSVEEEIS